MSVLRINWAQDRLDLLASDTELRHWRAQSGPIIVLLHGYKWAPGIPGHCPHEGLFETQGRSAGWIRSLRQGICANARILAVGWQARGAFGQVYHNAAEVGAALAGFLDGLAGTRIHLMAHSLGARVALSTLAAARQAQIDRIILMSPAETQIELTRALSSPLGPRARVVVMSSSENRVFDHLFEASFALRGSAPAWAISAHRRLPPEVLRIRMDCPETLARLGHLGIEIAPRRSRVCHWSGYLRPGVFDLYSALMNPEKPLSISYLKRVLPQEPWPATSLSHLRDWLRAAGQMTGDQALARAMHPDMSKPT